jgi:catechol 2,3-dioxygenase-like lactoylglutathione lyase family enzyme
MASPSPRLSNVILRVADLERSLAFWRDRVGLTVAGAVESFAFLDAGGARIALHAVQPPKDPEGGLAALTEIVLEVPDVRAAHAELSARGVSFRTEPRPATGNAERELWACDCRDPDGHIVSISGWVPKARAD